METVIIEIREPGSEEIIGITVNEAGPRGPTGPAGTVITSGTAPPSGGNDGDIYLQYTP
jgi:hypothetical protein